MRKAFVMDILRRVTYKPGWKLIAEHNPYDDERLVTLRLEFFAPCAVTGAPSIQVCATHILDIDRIDSEDRLMHDVRLACQRAEMHEVDEWLKLDGRAPFYPH